jgi:general L-amino acid transport system substrate-binding protein
MTSIMSMTLSVRLLLAGSFAFLSANVTQAGTLEEVRERDNLRCGVAIDRIGFSIFDAEGKSSGFDADTCRAVAAATLGDADKVVFVPVGPKERFTVLQSGDIDVLIRATTWTLTRDLIMNLNFAGVTFYDGQGFIVPKAIGVNAIADLDGAVICYPVATTSELNLAAYFKSKGLEFVGIPLQLDFDFSYENGRCDAYTNDVSALAGDRSEMRAPGDHTILGEVISKEPLGPVVRHGDDTWFDIIKWTVMALIQAEESGVTSENVDAMLASEDPTVRILLGAEGDTGLQMGLSNDWAYQIVKQVGNYGEIFERHLGPNTPVGLERGQNALWTDGGLLYAMPFR